MNQASTSPVAENLAATKRSEKKDKKSGGVGELIYRGVLGAIRGRFWLESRLAPGLASRHALNFFVKPQRPKFKWHESVPQAQTLNLETEEGQLRCYRWVPGKVHQRVVLIHGWSGAGRQLQYLVPRLLAGGCEVIAFDCIGHGESEGNEASLPTFIDMLARVDKAFGPFDAAVGHSLGGAALAYTLSQPQHHMKRAVLVSSPADIEDVTRRFADFLCITEPVRQGLQRLVEQRYEQAMPSLAVERYGAQIEIPVLLVHDEQDQEIPVADALRFAKTVGGSTLLTTKGLGHRKLLKDPATVATIADFILLD